MEVIDYLLFTFFLIISSYKLADFFANFPSQSFNPSRPHSHIHWLTPTHCQTLFLSKHMHSLAVSVLSPPDSFSLTQSSTHLFSTSLPCSLTHSLQFTNSFSGHSSVTFLVPTIFFLFYFCVCLSSCPSRFLSLYYISFSACLPFAICFSFTIIL